MYLEKLVIEGELWEVGEELYLDWQEKNIDDVISLRDVLDNTFSFTTEKLPDGSEIYSYGKMRITIEKLDD